MFNDSVSNGRGALSQSSYTPGKTTETSLKIRKRLPAATAATAAQPQVASVNTRVQAGGRKKSLYLREGDQTFETRSGYGSAVQQQVAEPRQRAKPPKIPGIPSPRGTAATRVA